MPRKSQRNARRKSKKGYKRGSPASKPTSRSSVSIVARKRDYTASSGSIVRGVMSKMYTMGAFPQQLFAKHIYSDSVLLALNVGGSCSGPHVFRLNSLFDPDFTGTGHQPQGYDNMALQYNRYIVYGVSIKIEFPINDLASASGMSGLYYINSGNDGYSLASKRVSDVIENNMGGAAILNTGYRSTVFDLGYRTIGAIQGQSNEEIMSGANFASVPGANPATVPTLQVGIGSIDQSCVANSFMCQVTIVYHTRWDNLKGQYQN